MFKKAKENKKGFTLAELLIVVAIIAVLVAISIPIFTSQLEKSREAVDAANIRAAYAEVASSAITDDKSTWYSSPITVKQQKAGWQSTIDFTGDIASTESTIMNTLPTGNIYVKYNPGTAGAKGTFEVTTTAPSGTAGTDYKTAGVND